MRLKLFVTATFLVTASIAAFAQTDEAQNPAPPTIEDVQKLVQTISTDKAKLKAFCELNTLYEQMEKAEEKNDTKEADALGVKIDSLEGQFGPDYRRVMDAWGEVDPNSAEGEKLTAIFEQLQDKCKQRTLASGLYERIGYPLFETMERREAPLQCNRC